MKSAKLKWVQGCAVCNAGIVSRVDELKSKGNSLVEACKIMEAEAFEVDGVLSISANAIRARYSTTKGTKRDWEDPEQGEPLLISNIKALLAIFRTATNKLVIINNDLNNKHITKLDGIEGLLARVDLSQFAKEFTTFIQYFKERRLISNEVSDKEVELKRKN